LHLSGTVDRLIYPASNKRQADSVPVRVIRCRVHPLETGSNWMGKDQFLETAAAGNWWGTGCTVEDSTQIQVFDRTGRMLGFYVKQSDITHTTCGFYGRGNQLLRLLT
jgi:hypothetical protein